MADAFGSLCVMIANDNDGLGQWSIDNGANWKNSGDVVTSIPVGEHFIIFKSVPGLVSPGFFVLNIADGVQTDLSFSYFLPSSEVFGKVCVKINDGDLIAKPYGAMFSLDNGTTWFESNSVVTVMAFDDNGKACSYDITFKDVAGFTKPIAAHVAFSSISDLNKTVSVAYTYAVGSIEVTMQGSQGEAVSGFWTYSTPGKIETEVKWYETGLAKSVPVGTYTIRYKTPSGVENLLNDTDQVVAQGVTTLIEKTVTLSNDVDVRINNVYYSTETPGSQYQSMLWVDMSSLPPEVKYYDSEASRWQLVLTEETLAAFEKLPYGTQSTRLYRGPSGQQGEPGPQGNQGAKGDTGSQGNTGPSGPAGVIGSPGPAGIPGINGVNGGKGDTGAVGPQGEKGDQGPSGPRGDNGPSGPVGPVGPVGPAGPSSGGYLPEGYRGEILINAEGVGIQGQQAIWSNWKIISETVGGAERSIFKSPVEKLQFDSNGNMMMFEGSQSTTGSGFTRIAMSSVDTSSVLCSINQWPSSIKTLTGASNSVDKDYANSDLDYLSPILTNKLYLNRSSCFVGTEGDMLKIANMDLPNNMGHLFLGPQRAGLYSEVSDGTGSQSSTITGFKEPVYQAGIDLVSGSQNRAFAPDGNPFMLNRSVRIGISRVKNPITATAPAFPKGYPYDIYSASQINVFEDVIRIYTSGMGVDNVNISDFACMSITKTDFTFSPHGTFDSTTPDGYQYNPTGAQFRVYKDAMYGLTACVECLNINGILLTRNQGYLSVTNGYSGTFVDKNGARFTVSGGLIVKKETPAY